jgi:hypothetical protein
MVEIHFASWRKQPTHGPPAAKLPVAYDLGMTTRDNFGLVLAWLHVCPGYAISSRSDLRIPIDTDCLYVGPA